MKLFADDLKKNKILYVMSLIFLGFVIVEGIQLLNYPFLIAGISPDYNGNLSRQFLPSWMPVFKPAVLLPFVLINWIFRLFGFLRLRRMNRSGRVIGTVSCIYTILLVAVMLPLNLVWEPLVMVILMIFIQKGYRKTSV